MTDGGQDFNLGHVVGSAGEKGDDGSTVWNTSTAPTYANSKYTFTISNLSGKTGLQIAVNDIIFYSTYYYIVSAVNTTTVDCSTRVSIKGSDASVTIVDNLTSTSSSSALSAKQGKVLNDNKIETSSIATSFGSTPSDSKVASEKLVKNSLDGKAPTSHASSSSTYGLGTTSNYGHVKTINGLTQSSHSDGTALSAYQGKVLKDAIDAKPDSSDIPTKTSDLTNDSNYISTSSTSGLIKNDGTIDTTSYSTFSGSYNDLSNKPTIPSASTTTPSADTSSGSYGSGTSYARSNHTHPQSSLYAEATHSHTKSQITDFPSIPTKTSDLTNDGADGTNVFVANNDSRLSDARTPTSHTHGNLTNDGKVGSTANYFVYTTTGGAITSKQKIGNITTSGAIGSTSGLPVITTTSGVLTTGSFGTGSGTFAEGNHTHSGYISTSSTTGLIKNDGSIMTSGTGSSNYAAGNHTHSGYVSATKVTSWSSTVSDSNVPSEKLVKDYIDNQIGTAIQYIQQ